MEARGIGNPQVLRAIRSVPRHLFVPPNLRAEAYVDGPLPIGFGQTISQPYIVAAMSELLDVSPSHRVLEIGTGSGYQAAVLSQLARHVYTIEIVPELAASAEVLLRRLNYSNITFRCGDGYLGWPEQAPFDRIILTAAPPEIPRALKDQLKPGGRLLAPVGRMFQDLVVLEKDAAGNIKEHAAFGVRFVPMVPKK
jgi:protein-L-isoaspartate(D-aspartate) O-methyltransferase